MLTSLKFFRFIGGLEALSFLGLLFIAVPLKYVWDMPIFVRFAGSIHGAFFLTFCLAIFKIQKHQGWPRKKAWLALLSACIPFGPFIFDYHCLNDDKNKG